MSALINQRNKLKRRKKKYPDVKKKIEIIEQKISKMEAKETRDIIFKNCQEFSRIQ